MFEKEAEEYVKEQFPNDEFLQSEISRKLVEFAEYGYNKANEWHYVKDGDLPKRNKEYVVKVKEYGGISVYIGRYWKEEKTFTGFTGSYLSGLDVIKWKEIE